MVKSEMSSLVCKFTIKLCSTQTAVHSSFLVKESATRRMLFCYSERMRIGNNSPESKDQNTTSFQFGSNSAGSFNLLHQGFSNNHFFSILVSYFYL